MSHPLSQVDARGTDGIDHLVAPWQQEEEEEEEEEEEGYERWITEHGGIQGTLYGPERLAFVGFFYIAHRYTSRQVSSSSPKPRHGTRIFTALRDTLFAEYCVILRTSEKGKGFWGEKLKFGTNRITDHQFLRWNKRHSEQVLEETIENLRVVRTPQWLDWVEVSNSCLRPPPPRFGIDQQADFGDEKEEPNDNMGVDEKEEPDDNKDDDIDSEERQRQPAKRTVRTWWKTLMAGDALTATQLATYRSVQRMFLDDVCVQGHAPAPDRVDSQVSCAHCTQAQSLTKSTTAQLTAVSAGRCLDRRGERSLSNSETYSARRCRPAVPHHTGTPPSSVLLSLRGPA
jgi:hypothetical protein